MNSDRFSYEQCDLLTKEDHGLEGTKWMSKTDRNIKQKQ